jgi:hypothetical protein
MPASKKDLKSKKTKTPSTSNSARLDIVFGGPLLFVPTVEDGNVTGVEVYSPRNGHPIGAVFLPDVWFTDAELNDPECERWPEPASFSLLDPHSYAIELTQRNKKANRPFQVAAIPETNHKVKPGRRLSGDWEVAISVNGQLSGWSSHRLADVKEGLYGGSDAPTSPSVAAMHRLTYATVAGAEFHGTAKEHKEYVRTNIIKGGSLIILGETPYQSSLLHERQAVSALAKLAGLDLHLLATAPTARRTHVMEHTGPFCGLSVIVA